MTSSNGNIFRVIGPLWVEFTGHRWIPLTKARDAELWSFLWSAPERLSKQSGCRWFTTPLHLLWRHCDIISIITLVQRRGHCRRMTLQRRVCLLCHLATKGILVMTSSSGSIFRVTGGVEFTGHRWIPLKKASDAELWTFLWSLPEQTVEQIIGMPVIYDAEDHLIYKMGITAHGKALLILKQKSSLVRF